MGNRARLAAERDGRGRYSRQRLTAPTNSGPSTEAALTAKPEGLHLGQKQGFPRAPYWSQKR